MQLAINIIDVINHEGVTLRKTGKVHKACCPFHQDKTPSFTVYEDSNRFICFGCGEKGDAIDFIMKLRNLTFKETLNFLGINRSGRAYKKDHSRQNKKREMIRAFRQCCNEYYDEITTEYRCINTIMTRLTSGEEFEKYSDLYHRLPELEYHMDILAFGDDRAKFDLYNEIDDVF